jgi:hypothetical protein
VFEKRMLRIIFGPKRKQVVGGWRTIHNKELHNLHDSPNFISVIKYRIVRWAGNVTIIIEMRNACKILVCKPEEKGQLGKFRRRCEDNIKMNLKETTVSMWTELNSFSIATVSFSTKILPLEAS